MTRRHLPLAASTALVAAAVLAQPEAVGRTRGGPDPLAVPVLEYPLPSQVHQVTDLALGRHDDLIVAGITGSPDFPTTADAADGACGIEGDAFVMVFSSGGTLRYSTCVGGSTTEEQAFVAPAGDGAIWVAATTGAEARWPGSSTNDTRALLWRIRPGVAGGQEWVRVGWPETVARVDDLLADADGSVWLLATTMSAGIVPVNAWQSTFGGGSSDILLARYGPGRLEPLLVTYLGGHGWDAGQSLAITPNGDAIVAGTTSSADFPLVRPVQSRFSGGASDAVIVRVDKSGRWLDYSTLLGGSSDEWGLRVAAGANGEVFVVGTTPSADFPPTRVTPPHRWHADVFFAALDDVGQLQAVQLLDTGVERIPAKDAGGAPLMVASRRDGSVVVVGGYYSDDLLSGSWFITMTDARGTAIREPLVTERPVGQTCLTEAAAFDGSCVYLAVTERSWLPSDRKVVKLRLERQPAEREPAGGHDRR